MIIARPNENQRYGSEVRPAIGGSINTTLNKSYNIKESQSWSSLGHAVGSLGGAKMQTSNTGQVAPTRHIVLLGRKTIQTSLLSEFLRSSLGYSVSATENMPQDSDDVLASNKLILMDYASLPEEEQTLYLDALIEMPSPPLVAFLNTREADEHDYLLDWPAVKGIFYEDVSQETLLQGVQAIFSGAFWFSQSLLYRYLEKQRRRTKRRRQSISVLTTKEQEILRLIASGKTNDAVAETLYISAHTVKSHLYNIFKKINVSNRIQATNWMKSCRDASDYQDA
jgi:LuxR family transcriptional regulator of csgAB operon